MRYASVILDIATQALDEPYTYAVFDGCAAQTYPASVGCAVIVPFGGRKAVGYIVSLSDDAPQLDPKKIKPIEQVVSKPFFHEIGAHCALYMANRYVAPLSSCIRLFTPPGGVPKMVKGPFGWRLEEPSVGQVDDRWVLKGPEYDGFTPKKNAIKQIAILEAVAAGAVRVSELQIEFGSVSDSLKKLESAGAIIIEHRRRLRGIDDVSTNDFVPSPKPKLNDGQKAAIAMITQAADRGMGEVVVVDGVTGSGKTEVYLHAIEHVLNQGKTAVVLVPEISLTPQTVGRFRGRFGSRVAVLHSKMSLGERYDQWDFIRSGEARVVVGARSALFSPLENVGLIVIDEEHEGSYKQDSAPRYVSRDVACWLATMHKGALVLGSATPSVESLYRCEHDALWHKADLPERANGKALPTIKIVDMAKEFSGGHRSMFSRELIAALERELSLGHKAVLLLNQRGFARFLLCRDCGFVPECPSCSTSLTYHRDGNLLMCHHCGYRMVSPASCPKCSSPYLRMFGAGTQRVEDDLTALVRGFSDPQASSATIVRMDADTTSTKGAHQRLLDTFASSDAAVLLGTQMIAKGLDFEDVTLVGVINADTMLKLPDYRAGERTFDLIEQVAGRAGRANLTGEVFVQTYQADNYAIATAAAYNRDAFLTDELPKRRLLAYPPYVRMANVLVWGKNEKEVISQAQELCAAITMKAKELGLDKKSDLVHNPSNNSNPCNNSNNCDDVSILPATPCLLGKLRDAYRWHICIRAPKSFDFSALLDEPIRTRKASLTVSVAVDVDPESLL